MTQFTLANDLATLASESDFTLIRAAPAAAARILAACARVFWQTLFI